MKKYIPKGNYGLYKLLFMCLLFSMPSMAQTRLGLHYTAEEVAVWKTRSTQGPYRVKGDAGLNSPADYSRILTSANAFISTSSSTNYLSDRWNGGWQGSGYVPKGFSAEITSSEPKGKMDKIMNAGFVYLITKDMRYANRVKSEILNYYIKHPLMDFSNQSRWGLGANSFNDINPGFFTAAGLTKLLYAYDYVKDTFSPQERAATDAWFYKAGNFFRKVVDEKIGALYSDRAKSILKNPQGLSVNSNGYKTHDNGYAIPNICHWYNNRRGDMVRFYALVGIHLNEGAMKASGKLFFKEWLKFGIFPDGTMNEYYRGSPAHSEQGFQYSMVTISQMIEIADAFARIGDPELYNFTTSEGLAATKGGTKSLLLVMQNAGRYIDRSFSRYYPGKGGQETYRLDGISPLEGKHYTFDTWFAQGNMFYRDANFTSIYTRKKAGTPPYPVSSQYIGYYQPWSGSFGTFPGKLFMFGQMEGDIYPYADSSTVNIPGYDPSVPVEPPFAITTTTTDIVCFGQSTGKASISVSGGKAPYTYLWSNGSTSASAENLTAGSHSVMITDASGTKGEHTVIITQPGAILIGSLVKPENSSAKNGSITLSVSGGHGGYSYKWSTEATTKDISSLAAGSYFITVTDAKGCTAATTVTVPLISSSELTIKSFTLINADTEEDIKTIRNGDQINLQALATKNLNIRANTTPATVGSVVFALSASQIRDATVNSAPYALFGANGNNYNTWNPQVGVYALKATPYSAANGTGTEGTPLSIVFTVVSTTPLPDGSETGAILQEFWSDIRGSSILAVPEENVIPTFSALLLNFETPVRVGDSYAQRIRGYVHPTESGSYTFYIAGDDEVELYLSTDDDPGLKTKIAYAAYATGVKEWTSSSTQQSPAIELLGGRKYYIEAVHKEDKDNDHLSVGWKTPSNQNIEVITAGYLSPFVTGGQNARVAAAETVKTTISVYPNPFSDQITVNTGVDETLQVVIADVLGRTLYGQQVESIRGEFNLNLARVNLKTGVYFLCLQGNTIKKKVVRIVKE